jgi:hypothetical protein
MPAPKKLLPIPCPKCGKEYGTAQIVIFNDAFHEFEPYRRKDRIRLIIRIKHYYRDIYEYNRSKVTDNPAKRQMIRQYRNQWKYTRLDRRNRNPIVLKDNLNLQKPIKQYRILKSYGGRPCNINIKHPDRRMRLRPSKYSRSTVSLNRLFKYPGNEDRVGMTFPLGTRLFTKLCKVQLKSN